MTNPGKKDNKKDPKKNADLMKDIKKLTNLEKELKEAKKNILESEEKIKELTETHTRVLADLQNYRRRSEEEKIEFVRFANVELIKEILPSIDNFKKSLTFIPKDSKKENWCQGIIHTIDHFAQTLAKLGLKEIECVGEKIDPNLHDAVLQGPGKKDIIIEEMEKGYMFQDKVIKHAKVKVGSGLLSETLA